MASSVRSVAVLQIAEWEDFGFNLSMALVKSVQALSASKL